MRSTCFARCGKTDADPAPALPVLLERERRLHQVAGRAGDAFGLLAGAGVERLAVPLVEFRLVVERVHLADAAVHEQLHDALDLRGVMQPAVELGPSVSRRAISPASASSCARAIPPRPPPE